MSTSATAHHDAHHDEHHDTGRNTTLGFWIYLMTDCILFSCFFATYAVLFMNTAGGVSGKDIFDLNLIAGGTAALLLSSITFGFAMISAYKKSKGGTLLWLAVTFLFGATFIAIELYEFNHLIHAGHGPSTSAFLTAFFSLVGLHGLHVTAGLLWITVMFIDIAKRGLLDRSVTRLGCLSLFWHFLDVIWICVFSFVYLMGAM